MKAEQRGVEPLVRRAEKIKAVREASSPKLSNPPDWSRGIQTRQENIRQSYLGHADELIKGDAADRQLARDIRRFVADMPVPLTRRQAMAVELRHVLEQQLGRGTPLPVPSIPNNSEIPRQETPTPAPAIVHPSMSLSKGRS